MSGAGQKSGGATPSATSSEDGPGALSHLRVLDLTSASAAYAGKLLADLGADVIKIEPPGGDPARREAPHGRDGASLPFRYENANKRSLVLDLASRPDREDFVGLAREADLVLEALPVGRLPALGLDFATLSEENPGLVLTSISGFGQTGPHAALRSNDLVASALGGAMTSIGDPADPRPRGDRAVALQRRSEPDRRLHPAQPVPPRQGVRGPGR